MRNDDFQVLYNKCGLVAVQCKCSVNFTANQLLKLNLNWIYSLMLVGKNKFFDRLFNIFVTWYFLMLHISIWNKHTTYVNFSYFRQIPRWNKFQKCTRRIKHKKKNNHSYTKTYNVIQNLWLGNFIFILLCLSFFKFIFSDGIVL